MGFLNFIASQPIPHLAYAHLEIAGLIKDLFIIMKVSLNKPLFRGGIRCGGWLTSHNGNEFKCLLLGAIIIQIAETSS